MTEAAAPTVLQRDHRSARGTIAYLSHKPDRYLQPRGREYFHIDVHSDGQRTITAHCEIDDRPSVMRDITYSLDAQWLPLDCFVRITVGDRFMGSGWFKFQHGYTECETFTATEGRVSQRMEHRNAPLRTFQNHAIACDAWHLRLYDRSKGPGHPGHRRVPALVARPSRRHRPDAVSDRRPHRVRRRENASR